MLQSQHRAAPAGRTRRHPAGASQYREARAIRHRPPGQIPKPCIGIMAIFHLNARVVSRSQGHSAVAKAAYIARTQLKDERLNWQLDYRRKGGILFSGIFVPKDAPTWARDRAELWNQAEAAEDRKDSTIAREYEIGLPHELTLEQNRWLVQDFVKANFTRQGYAADVNIHAPDSKGDPRNIHVHILVTDRRLEADGFAADKKERQGTYKERAEAFEALRESWEHHANRHLERHGHAARIDRRTLAAQGIDRTATSHLGPHIVAMQRRGLQPNRYAELKQVLENNELIFDLTRLRGELAEVQREIALEMVQDWNRDNGPRLSGRFSGANPSAALEAARKQGPPRKNGLRFLVPPEAGPDADELKRKRRAGRAGATLYDRAGMASMQRDALRDHAERQRRAEQKRREQKTLQAERQPEPEPSVPEIDPEAAKAKALALAEVIREGSGTGPRTHAVEKTLQRSADAGRPLDTEQAAALRHAMENGFAILQGRAGTGKSFTLNAIRETYEQEGFEVIGLAPTHAAAHELREAGFAEARTLHSFLYAEQRRAEQGRPAPEGPRVLIVDEAGMVSDRHLIAIMETAAVLRARVVLAGDDRQLKSIEKGGLFADLAAARAAELTTVYRQRDDWQKTATRAFGQGDTVAGLEAYHERGFIHYTEGDRPQAAAELVKQWVVDRDEDRAGTRFVFAVTNADSHEVNALIQAEQIKAGLVTNAQTYTITGEREIRIGEGDRVQFRGNDKANGIFNGMLATVEKIDSEAPHLLNVRLDNGEPKSIDTNEYRDIQLGYAGTVYRGQGKTLDRSYVLFSPYMDARAAYVADTRAREETHLYAATGDLDARYYRGHIRAEGLAMPETDFEKLIAVIKSRAAYNELRPQQQRKSDPSAAVEVQRQDLETAGNPQRQPEKPARDQWRVNERESRHSERSRDGWNEGGRGGGGRTRER
jgi:ATP-dependent exoDNAse (exonuclease V) alpha subunit